MEQLGTTKQELLYKLRRNYTHRELADLLNVTPRTVKRWETLEDGPPSRHYKALELLLTFQCKDRRQQLLFLTQQNQSAGPRQFTFIDLFAGIGGMRMGFESVGGECVFTSEWDRYALQTYMDNFLSNHMVRGDITLVNTDEIPEHDVLLAGFPCQPFSIAGVSKKNSLGKRHGFKCKAQGTLFFDVARIIKKRKPKAILLENVKNLRSHDKGRTFQIIEDVLTEELGYKIYPKVIDAKGFVPQHRERIYIVGFREDTDFSWEDLPQVDPDGMTLGSILHPQDGSEQPEGEYTKGASAHVNKKYILTDKLWKYLTDYAAKHKAKGNGFGYGLVTKNNVARTLSARYYKDGSEILISRGRGNPRRLTPRECARLMGYPDTFKIPVSDVQSYKQFGNSVAVPVIMEIARLMKPHIIQLKRKEHKETRKRLC